MSKLFFLPLTELLEATIDNRGKSVPLESTGFPLIATNCIKHSSIYPTFENIRFISKETHENWFRSHLKPNDILFVNKGTPGRTCLVPDPVGFCVAQDMIGLRCNNNKIHYKYLFAVLRSKWMQQKIENYHVGLVIPHFKKQDLPSLLIPIKSREDQISIGRLYVELSQKIELNNRINAELERLAKTIYDYWFVQFDFPYDFDRSQPDEHGKPYKSSGGEMVYNAELYREIPAAWEDSVLNTLVEFHYGKGLKTETRTGFGSPVIGSSGIIGYHSDFLVEGPGIVVGRKGTIGAITYLHENFYPIDTTYYVKPTKPIKFFFLYFLLRTLGLERMNSDSAVPGLNRDFALSSAICLPPLRLIQKFESCVAPVFQKIENNDKQNQQLTQLRDWLLPMLISGQVRVK